MKKFHWRYYDKVPLTLSSQEGYQNTFSITDTEAFIAKTTLESGKYLATSNMFFETTAFGLWSAPNFREKTTQETISEWPVYGWNYDVLIGGLYPDQKPEVNTSKKKPKPPNSPLPRYLDTLSVLKGGNC